MFLAMSVWFASATAAQACDCTGSVVCASTGAPISGVAVTFSPLPYGGAQFSATTDASGNFSVEVGWVGFDYGATLDLSAAGGASSSFEQPAACAYAGETVAIPAYQVVVPGCSANADCSPGYYKNHPETWCGTCSIGSATCAEVLGDLSTRGPGSDAVRAAAKGMLDACFGTAESSPCVDDDG
jgi:hypothetical protein